MIILMIYKVSPDSVTVSGGESVYLAQVFIYNNHL